MFVSSMGIGTGFGAVGFAGIHLKTDYNGKKGEGKFDLLLFGYSLSPPWFSRMHGMKKPTYTIGSVTVYSPGIFGPNAWLLSGPSSFGSLTAAWGGGVSITMFTMGMGGGELSLSIPGWGLVIGKGISSDIMTGVSIPMYIR